MATVSVEVGTWPELDTAIRNYIYSGDDVIIQITADIDCNPYIPEGLATSFGGGGMGGGTLTITGAHTEGNETKNYKIRNLRTHITNPVTIFKIGAYQFSSRKTITFKNIDFINLILDAPFFTFIYVPNPSNWKVYFNDCSFVGRRTNYFLTGSNDSSAGQSFFTSCFLNIDYKNTSNTYLLFNGGTNYPSLTAHYCRIKQNYTGWSIGTATNPYDAVQNTTHNMYLDGCYLYGDFVGTGDSSSASINITNRFSYNAPIQNVVDADLRLGGTPTAGMNCTVVAPKGIFENEIHKLNENPATTTYTAVNYNDSGDAKAISIDPADMTNPQALYNVGFDIVVPETT